MTQSIKDALAGLSNAITLESSKQNGKLIKLMLDAAYKGLETAKTDSQRGMYARASEYYNEAMVLIRILEIYHCGSVGGFDKGQTDRSETGRLGWLREKLAPDFIFK